MEISEIQKAKSVGRVQKKERVHQPKIEDRLSISSDSKKKAEWVGMLKQMPDVRPDKLNALSASPTNQELAYKILNSDT